MGEKDHGRIETRRCVVTDDVAGLAGRQHDWPAVKTLMLVESRRESKGVTSTDRRYYTPRARRCGKFV